VSPFRRRSSKLQRLFKENRPEWDNDKTSLDVRAAINKWLLCGTGALGAEVYSSQTGEFCVVGHTCKSKACTSCGHWKTICWQQEVASQLPNIPYYSVLLTMPDVLWWLLRDNRHLLPSLPALGAGVLTDWVRERFQAEVLIVCVPHTFNPQLEFNAHLHIVVGRLGLHINGNQIVRNIYFPLDVVRKRWQKALLDVLELEVPKRELRLELSRDESLKWKKALYPELKIDELVKLEVQDGRKFREPSVHEVLEMIACHRERLWKVGVRPCRDKRAILEYISRYMRRPPIAEYRVVEFDENCVRFLYFLAPPFLKAVCCR
jgi:Putative transposase/Transposase zinc-binding domain